MLSTIMGPSVRLALLALALLLPLASVASSGDLPRIVTKNGRHALFVDGAPFLMLGAQIHNSSSWPSTLPNVWRAMEFLGVNTVEAPVYWEQMEPLPGQFDFSLVDNLVDQAREHHVRLVILWFATWKNGSGHYWPEWMKRDPVKYPKLVNKLGQFVDSPSPHAQATLEADKHAFKALMAHLKAKDPNHTVIMVQVENEPGTWGGATRDHSPEAERLFAQPVAKEALKAMGKPTDTPMTWQQAFGPDADEYFHAWSIATFIGQVAEAGKSVYPLPMYVNAALRDPIAPGPAGTYETGGATDNVLPLYKAAAPAIDILAPDIYVSETDKYRKVINLYARPDNPLFIPETSGGSSVSRLMFDALDKGAIGYSPFGVDTPVDTFPPATDAQLQEALMPHAQNCRLLGPNAREIAQLNFDGKLHGFVELAGQYQQELTLGPWRVIVSYQQSRGDTGRPTGAAQPPLGCALVAELGQDQFLVTGLYSRVEFRPVHGGPWRFLRVEAGGYQDGEFRVKRILNGDETDWGINFRSGLQFLRVSVLPH